MSLIARTNRWHEEQLWNVSLLPASKLEPAGQTSPTPHPMATRWEHRRCFRAATGQTAT